MSGLKIHPEPGSIVLCSYEPGFKAPEMVKRRPVVIISPRHRSRDNLCTVVPLSSKSPDPIEPYHYVVKLDRNLPSPWSAPYYWVKADMLATVAFHRLHLIGVGRDKQTSKRRYIIEKVTELDLLKIRKCVLHALGMPALTDHL